MSARPSLPFIAGAPDVCACGEARVSNLVLERGKDPREVCASCADRTPLGTVVRKLEAPAPFVSKPRAPRTPLERRKEPTRQSRGRPFSHPRKKFSL